MVAILALAEPAWGATYYVSTSGNDANTTTEAQNVATPWRTVGKCLQALVAGDTCYVRAGTYSEGTISPATSGTAGNVITLSAYPGERPHLQATRIYLFNKSYITIDGFECTRSSPCVETEDAQATPSSNITVRNIYAHFILRAVNDITTAFYLNACDSCVVEDSVAHTICNNCTDVNNPATCLCRDKNAAAILTYNSWNSTIRRNTFYDTGEGVFIKSPPGANGSNAVAGPHWTIQQNYIHDVDEGVWLSVSGGGDNAHRGITITDNLFDACRVGVLEDVADASYGDGLPSDLVIANNTFGTMTAEAILFNGWAGTNTVYNNLFVGNTNEAYQSNAITLADYNIFLTGRDTFDVSTTQTCTQPSCDSLATLQAATTFEDHGQTTADLQFISGTFRISATSPAYNACRVGGVVGGAVVHCGAPADHADTVGVAPGAPTGVTVE